jgi:hypothetical protein
MTREEAGRLAPGVYRIWWEEGGSSVASVGILHDGTPWFMPANWTGDGKIQASTDWDDVERVELIAQGPYDHAG